MYAAGTRLFLVVKNQVSPALEINTCDNGYYDKPSEDFLAHRRNFTDTTPITLRQDLRRSDPGHERSQPQGTASSLILHGVLRASAVKVSASASTTLQAQHPGDRCKTDRLKEEIKSTPFETEL